MMSERMISVLAHVAWGVFGYQMADDNFLWAAVVGIVAIWFGALERTPQRGEQQ